MRVCLGGTFDRFHVGHEALLAAAADGADEVFVGVTADALARRDRRVEPWERRAAAVEAFLRGLPFAGLVVAKPLRDAVGPAATEAYDRIVVSPETAPGVRQIQRLREESGLAPLEVRVVPYVIGEDRLPVSATAVAQGRIDRRGRRLRPVVVALGSQNPVKAAAVEAGMRAFLGAPCVLRAVAVASGVPEQPRDGETLQGAKARARAARLAVPEADYAVGVEAGLVAFPGDEGPCDVQACCVLDRGGLETVGWGPAFHHPSWVTGRALAGETVSSVLGPVARDPAIGGTTGAVGYLSEGTVDRAELTRVGLRMALLPRMRRALYCLPEDQLMGT